MKFWQKLYLSTLALFLTVFTCAILVLVHSLYENNLNVEKEKGRQEALWLSQRLSEDFGTLKETPFSSKSIASLLNTYSYDFVLKNSLFSLYHEDELLYTNLKFEDAALIRLGADTVQARIYWLGNDCYYCISVPFAEYPGYQFL